MILAGSPGPLDRDRTRCSAGVGGGDNLQWGPDAGQEAVVDASREALVAYAMFMMAVCMLACIVPTRRALRIEPMEALRRDG